MASQLRTIFALGIAAVVAGGRAGAQTTLPALQISPDISTVIGSLAISDEDLLQDDLAGHVSALMTGLPAAADLASYHRDADGARLLVFDTSVALSASVTATPRDVVRWDGGAFTLAFRGAVAGVPDGAAVDVVTRAPSGNLVLSFDIDVSLGSATYGDEDLVEWDGSTFGTFFDGSGAGIDPALDVDAADVLPSGRILLSLDGSGVVGVGAVDFDDEDVLEVGPDGSNWHRDYDGSAQHPELAAADVDVVQYLVVAPGLPFGDGFETGNIGKWTWRLP